MTLDETIDYLLSDKFKPKHLNALIEEFIEVKKSEKTASTLQLYRYALYEFERYMWNRLGETKRGKTFIPYWGRGKFLCEVLKEDLSAFVLNQMDKVNPNTGKKLSSSTVLPKFWAISLFAKWLKYRKILASDLYDEIEEYFPNFEKNKDDRRALIPDEEFYILRNLSNPMFRMMAWVGANYGLRCREFANLELKHIDLEHRVLTVHGKRNKYRYIGIPEEHVDEWKRWLTIRGNFPLNHKQVFFSSKGKATHRTIQRYFNKMSEHVYPIPEGLSKEETDDFKKANWFTTHILRYTYATKLYLGNADLEVIRDVLGHNSLSTTTRYLRIDEKESRKRYLEQVKGVLT